MTLIHQGHWVKVKVTAVCLWVVCLSLKGKPVLSTKCSISKQCQVIIRGSPSDIKLTFPGICHQLRPRLLGCGVSVRFLVPSLPPPHAFSPETATTRQLNATIAVQYMHTAITHIYDLSIWQLNDGLCERWDQMVFENISRGKKSHLFIFVY